MDAYADRELLLLAEDALREDSDGGTWWGHLVAARRLRGSLWAMDAAPWDDSLSLTNHEWDVQWRLNFGGITEPIRRVLDRPERGTGGHGRRGKMMEYIVHDAAVAMVPRGAIFDTVMQPLVEHYPMDHVDRCLAAGDAPLGDRRADIALSFRGGRRLNIDVGTTNLVSNTALSNTCQGYIESVEATKDRSYAD